MSGNVVVVGSINADLSVQVMRHPAPGETVAGNSARVRPGGKGANQAVAAALLGADVTMVGAVGDDANARVALERMVESGLDSTHVRRVPGSTGLAIVAVDERAENTIVVVPGANQHVDAAHIEQAAATIRTADVVVAQGELPAVATARAAALTEGRFVLNLAPVISLPGDVIRRADPLVVNEHEGALALAMLQPGQPVTPTRSHADVARALVDAGIPSVVMTLGCHGALVVERGEEVTHVPAAKVDAVDTTGAGDAFVGALASRIAEGEQLVEAARFASTVGAYACTRPGAQDSYPDRDQALPALS